MHHVVALYVLNGLLVPMYEWSGIDFLLFVRGVGGILTGKSGAKWAEGIIPLVA